MIEPHGGDTIETTDGRIGVIVLTRFDLRNGVIVYGIKREGDPNQINMYDPEYADRRVQESEVARIISYGRHTYRMGGDTRGHCARCGVAKREHN